MIADNFTQKQENINKDVDWLPHLWLHFTHFRDRQHKLYVTTLLLSQTKKTPDISSHRNEDNIHYGVTAIQQLPHQILAWRNIIKVE